jgi:hypothetical protein
MLEVAVDPELSEKAIFSPKSGWPSIQKACRDFGLEGDKSNHFRTIKVAKKVTLQLYGFVVPDVFRFSAHTVCLGGDGFEFYNFFGEMSVPPVRFGELRVCRIKYGTVRTAPKIHW